MFRPNKDRKRHSARQSFFSDTEKRTSSVSQISRQRYLEQHGQSRLQGFFFSNPLRYVTLEGNFFVLMGKNIFLNFLKYCRVRTKMLHNLKGEKTKKVLP